MFCVFQCTFIDPLCFFFFFNDTATTEIYTLSLHDALPIDLNLPPGSSTYAITADVANFAANFSADRRSEEHTSELQSRLHLVCRLLLEKKKKKKKEIIYIKKKKKKNKKKKKK